MKLLKYIIVVLIAFTSTTYSNTLDGFINTLDEQVVISEWVMANSNKALTQQAALSIVKDTYAYSLSNNLNPKLVIALMKTESGFIHKAKSKGNALGLMQVIKYWHKDKIKGRSLYDQKVSIEVGTIILKDCFLKHRNNKNKSLGCYNGNSDKRFSTKVNKYQDNLHAYIYRANQTVLASNI